MNINATLLGQMISFGIFVWFCMKFVWPILIQAMKDREAKIAEGLAAAERGEHEQELAEQRAKELLKDAKAQAAEVLAQAQKRGNELVEEAKVTANAESDRIKASAQAEIEQQVNQAKTALREHVVEIALKGTERILKREVDAKAHKEVLDDLVSQV